LCSFRPVFLDDSFDVARSTAGGYASFLADFDYHVGTTASRKIKNHALLGRQQVETAPPAWLRIHLTGGYVVLAAPKSWQAPILIYCTRDLRTAQLRKGRMITPVGPEVKQVCEPCKVVRGPRRRRRRNPTQTWAWAGSCSGP